MNIRKAVIFARTSDGYMDATGGKAIETQLSKLRKYAQKNDFEVLKEFTTIESCPEPSDRGLTGSPVFLNVMNFIKLQKNKIFVICYEEFNRENCDLEIEERFKELLSQQKIEIKNYRHPCFKEPSGHTKIWRYVSLPKFIDLLQSSELFFTRGDFMRALDKYSGMRL